MILLLEIETDILNSSENLSIVINIYLRILGRNFHFKGNKIMFNTFQNRTASAKLF